ncbi:MAG: hypothetical protein AABN34_02335 [Acidobacteriota bacterium]
MPPKSSECVPVSNEGSVMIPSMLLLSAHNLPPAGATGGARAPRGSDFVLMKERN